MITTNYDSDDTYRHMQGEFKICPTDEDDYVESLLTSRSSASVEREIVHSKFAAVWRNAFITIKIKLLLRNLYRGMGVVADAEENLLD